MFFSSNRFSFIFVLMKKLWIPFVLILLIAGDLFLGSVNLSFPDIINALTGHDSTDYVYKIIWNFRIPKMITALLAGMSLAVCGAQMQTLFRNPLADPHVLGISSGAVAWCGILRHGIFMAGCRKCTCLAYQFGNRCLCMDGSTLPSC